MIEDTSFYIQWNTQIRAFEMNWEKDSKVNIIFYKGEQPDGKIIYAIADDQKSEFKSKIIFENLNYLKGEIHFIDGTIQKFKAKYYR